LSALLTKLNRKGQRGSKPRCHLLMHGTPKDIATRLSTLVAPYATVGTSDQWMPQGFTDIEEAQLHKAPRLLNAAVSSELARWWLPTGRLEAMTPNFDVASTCTIEGKARMLLVEAKAHEGELTQESAGRRLRESDSEDRKASHETIGAAISAASAGLAAETGLPWNISRDGHYQISNRFAWAWKLAALGIPVVLVYLGFLKASDMSKPGELAFADAGAWEALVRSHSAPLFPGEVWNRRWSIGGVPLIPLIRSVEVALEAEA
jgi:hypothetical protein